MQRSLEQIDADLKAHEQHDEARFKAAHDMLNSHHETALEIKESLHFIQENHLAHIEKKLGTLDSSLAKTAVDIGWMKWLLVPIAIPVIDAISKIIKSYL